MSCSHEALWSTPLMKKVGVPCTPLSRPLSTSMPAAALTGNQPFWIRMEYRAEAAATPADQSDNSGFTLSGLIDIFSRRPRSEQSHGSDEAGPLRLDNLRRK